MIQNILNWKIVRRIRFGCACFKIVRDYCASIAGETDPAHAKAKAQHAFRNILHADQIINPRPDGGASIPR